jgi:serine protease Do
MDINLKSIVRILSQSIAFDWKSPFNKSINIDSIGTGFFIDKNYIITCSHVIENAVKIYITIPSLGKEKYEAELISCCPYMDIALLKTTNYDSSVFLELDDSDKVKATNKVFAVGYPLGLDNAKFSSGIVSGIQEYFFQTDAPINEGNSGGPLINENNKVIGINSSKIPKSEGMGFSIPINFFIHMKDLMMNNKIIRKCTLLCEFNNIEQNLWNYCTEHKIDKEYNTGYYIKKCYEDSTLFREHGVKNGDILLEINGYKLDNYGEIIVPWSDEKINLSNLLRRYNINEIINIKIWSSKNKKIIDFNYKLDYIYPINLSFPMINKVDYFIFGGLVIMNFCLNHLKEYDGYYKDIFEFNSMEFRKNPKVIISQILSGSTIKKDDIIVDGDLIVSINDEKIENLNDILRVVDTTFDKYKGYLLIKNHKDDTICVNIKTGLIETYRLSKIYGYEWKNDLVKVIVNKLPNHD